MNFYFLHIPYFLDIKHFVFERCFNLFIALIVGLFLLYSYGVYVEYAELTRQMEEIRASM